MTYLYRAERFNIGDKVKVREDLQDYAGKDIGTLRVTPSMASIAGETVEITGYSLTGNRYGISKDTCFWHDGCFEGLAEETEEQEETDTQDYWEEFTGFLVNESEFGHEDKDYRVIEKPVIPQFVAEWIEENGRNYPHDVIGLTYVLQNNQKNLEDVERNNRLMRWLTISQANRDKFATAWRYGYTVEPEKRFKLKANFPQVSENSLLYLNKKTYEDGDIRWELNSASSDKYFQTIFTETELEDIDETGFERIEVTHGGDEE